MRRNVTQKVRSKKWRSVIAVSLKVGGGVRLFKPGKTVLVHAKHYKDNKEGHTASGVCGHGTVPLSLSGNVVTEN